MADGTQSTAEMRGIIDLALEVDSMRIRGLEVRASREAEPDASMSCVTQPTFDAIVAMIERRVDAVRAYAVDPSEANMEAMTQASLAMDAFVCGLRG